jgi:hypothetical protein
LDAAREWIFGPRNDQSSSSGCGGIVELRRVAGASAFAITPAQLNEAAWAFNALAGHSLITAVEFYLKHASQPRRSKPLSDFIDEHIAAIAEGGGGERYRYLLRGHPKIGSSLPSGGRRKNLGAAAESTGAPACTSNFINCDFH